MIELTFLLIIEALESEFTAIIHFCPHLFTQSSSLVGVSGLTASHPF